MYNEIIDKIKEYDTIVIARHVGVDPDALCSQLALRESIRKTFPDKNVLAVGASSTRFSYFPKLDRMPSELDGLLIIVDSPDKKRVDIPDISNFSKTIKIDHHPCFVFHSIAPTAKVCGMRMKYTTLYIILSHLSSVFNKNKRLFTNNLFFYSFNKTNRQRLSVFSLS